MTKKKYFHIQSRKKLDGQFLANFKSAYHGHGIEFQDFREYSYGDDAKYIDWGASSKENTLIMRRYREDRQGEISVFWYDSHTQNQFGCQEKFLTAQNVISSILEAAVYNSMKFHAYRIANNLVSKTQGTAPEHILSFLEENNTPHNSIPTQGNYDFFLQKKQKKQIIFIISDECSSKNTSLQILGKLHDCNYIHIASEFENTLQGSGVMRLLGKNHALSINLDDHKKRDIYIQKRKKQQEDFKMNMGKFGIPVLFLTEESDIVESFMNFMHSRLHI